MGKHQSLSRYFSWAAKIRGRQRNESVYIQPFSQFMDSSRYHVTKTMIITWQGKNSKTDPPSRKSWDALLSLIWRRSLDIVSPISLMHYRVGALIHETVGEELHCRLSVILTESVRLFCYWGQSLASPWNAHCCVHRKSLQLKRLLGAWSCCRWFIPFDSRSSLILFIVVYSPPWTSLQTHSISK